MLLQYEIYFPMASNKTAQQNSQHGKKLHNQVHKQGCSTIKFIEKLIFFVF